MIATKKLWSELLFKKAAFNFLLNIILNFLIQYFVLKDYDTLAIAVGEQNLAKIFIPFGFFLPFFISMDSIGYAYKMVAKEKVPGVFTKDFKHKLFGLKVGAKNGLFVLIGVILMLFILGVIYNQNQVFDKERVIAFQVVLSGVLAIYFTYQPISLLKKKDKLFV